MESFDYVILGAGLGGLSAAACLTRQKVRKDQLGRDVLWNVPTEYAPGEWAFTWLRKFLFH